MSLNPMSLVRRFGMRKVVKFLAHLPSFLKLFARLVKDPRVRLSPKLILVGSLLYVILPIDMLPDIILGIGQVDDLVIIFLGIKLFLRLCPKEVVQEHVQSIAAGY